MKIKITKQCIGVPEWVVLNKEYNVEVYGGRPYITEPSVGIYASVEKLFDMCGSAIGIIQPSEEACRGVA